ncbi:hypothetical protein ACFQ1L_04800 [Phytohabitans flavus]|uniref:hypothetical protein n=1 Tax=Phytohabitans flavus TaxID=1076124 RepID=UPI00363DAB67
MHRLSARIALSTAVVGAAALVPAAPVPASSPGQDIRQREYTAAAAAYGVPESVLLGVSYLESRWDTNAGTPSTSGGYGPMHLTDAEYVTALPSRSGNHHDHDGEDPRGDSSRPARNVDSGGVPAPAPEALQTLDRAAAITGASEADLRTTPRRTSPAGRHSSPRTSEALVDRRGARATPRPGMARWPGTAARTAPMPRRPSPTRSSRRSGPARRG